MKILRILRKDILIDVLIIFILSLTPLLWFQKDTIMVGHDNVFPLNPSVFLDGRLYSWIELGFGRSQALIMGTIPVHFIDALPYFLGNSVQTTQKIVYVFWFFMIGIGAYVLASVLNKESRFFKLTSVVFYLFNFFILQAWWIGERTKFSAYIAFPLILAVFFKVYKNELKAIKGAILISLVLFIFNGGGLFGISLYGGFFIAIIAFIIFFSFVSYYQKQYDIVKRILLLVVFSIFGFVLINSYYVFPAVSQIASRYTEGVQKSGGLSGLVDWASEISANTSYVNLMRLQGIAEWYDNPEHPYAKIFLTNPILVFVSFLWPFLIFLSLFLIKKGEKLKIASYFLVVYLLGIFFAAGTHPPLGFIYKSFIKYIPGAIAFRSPYFKFAPAIFLATSFLIAFFVDYFQGKNKKIIFFLIALTVIIYHFPYFTGDFFSWRKGFSTRNNVPDYVFEFGKWVENNMEKDGRILLLPQTNNNWQYDIYKWGYLSLQSLPTLVTNKGIVTNDDKTSNDEVLLLQKLYKAIDNKDYNLVKKLTTLLGIKYFLIRYDFESDLEWIPATKPDFYKTILEKDFKLNPKNQFGKWTLYQIDQDKIAKFTIIDKIDNVYGPHKNIDDYYALSQKNSDFVFASDLKSYLVKNTFDYIIPECLNCRHELPPSINFPRRLILPDSIFYPIIKYKEKKEMLNLKPREIVYADLGHTLKRIGEILATLDQGKKISPVLLVNYLDVLKNIENHFNQISDYKDKFEAAEDIDYYLTAQKKYLYELLGEKINNKENLDKIEDIFAEIVNIENTTEPYLFKLDFSNNRFFFFNLAKSGSYEIFMKREDISSLIKEKTQFKLLLNGQDQREVKIDNKNYDQWFSFGEFNLALGNHSLLLSLPELPNLLDDFSSQKKWFGTELDNNCYGSNIKNFDNKRVYKLQLEIINDFSERVSLYEIRTKKGKEHIESIAAFKKYFEKDNYRNLIYSTPDIDNTSIYLCSNNLNNAIAQDKIKIKVTEVINPVLVMKPKTIAQRNKSNLSYKEINPTKYLLEIDNDKPSFMVFTERYDDGWKLSDFNNHFKINAYANGWYLDKIGKYRLILEYQPQNFFYYGIIVSAISIIASLFYLAKTRNT